MNVRFYEMNVLRDILILVCISIVIGCKQDTKKETSRTVDSAVDELSRLIQKTPDDDELYFERAKQFYKDGLYDEAIADMQYAMRIDSLKPPYYHFLSDVFMDYYRSKESIQTMEAARRRFPEDMYTMLKLAETQFILEQYEDMEYTNRAILMREPRNADGHVLQGMLRRVQGELNQAKSAFQTAVEIDPEQIDAWLFLGSLYEDENDPLALNYYTSATQVDSLNINAWHSLAFYYQNNEEIDKALEIYRKINRLNRDYNAAYLNAGILHLEREEDDKAFEQFNILVKVNPQSYQGYYYRGLVYEKRGELEAARIDFQNAVNLNYEFEKADEALKRVKSGQDK